MVPGIIFNLSVLTEREGRERGRRGKGEKEGKGGEVSRGASALAT